MNSFIFNSKSDGAKTLPFYPFRLFFLCVLAAILVVGCISYRGFIVVKVKLNVADMITDGDNGWVYYNFSQRHDLVDVGSHQDQWTRSGLFFSEGDDNAGDRHGSLRAALTLLEDGKPLGPAHAFDDAIHHTGDGAFSFRAIGQDRVLAFSTSDNSDPRNNGRQYRVFYPIKMAPGLFNGAIILFCFLILMEWVRARRHPIKVFIGLIRLTVITVLAGLVAGGAASYAGRLVLTQNLNPSFMGPDSGTGWLYFNLGNALTRWGLFFTEGDNNSGPRHGELRSGLTLLENGKPLGPAHASDGVITGTGAGAYAYRAIGTDRALVFSSSDNSDPRDNARHYLVRYPIVMNTNAFHAVLFLFCCLIMAEWMWLNRRTCTTMPEPIHIVAESHPKVRYPALSLRNYLITMALLVILMAPIISIWRDVAVCRSDGYGSDNFLADCDSPAYGVNEHGAFYFDVESQAIAALRSADVLFLGNSKPQFAFSTAATAAYFSHMNLRYYLMGFVSDDSVFARLLMERFQIHPKLVIINADPFFSSWRTAWTAAIIDTPVTARYRAYRNLIGQQLHKLFSAVVSRGWLGWGSGASIFRSRSNGSWLTAYYKPDQHVPLQPEADVTAQQLSDTYDIAKDFRPLLPEDDQCTVVVYVPGPFSSAIAAHTIAQKMHFTYISADLPGLMSVEGHHLDRPSAERWSAAIVSQLGPVIRHCVLKS